MIEGLDPDALGEAAGWRALDAALRPFVARRVAAADVDDVVQDVFLRLQRGLGELRDEARLGPWVYRLARSAIVDHARREARHPPAPADAEPAAPEAEDGPDEGATAELARAVGGLVDALPPPYAEIVRLTELEGLRQTEAAARLGLSVSGAKSRVQRGRRLLRERLHACCDIALDARRRVVACTPKTEGPRPDGCCAGPGEGG